MLDILKNPQRKLDIMGKETKFQEKYRNKREKKQMEILKLKTA